MSQATHTKAQHKAQTRHLEESAKQKYHEANEAFLAEIDNYAAAIRMGIAHELGNNPDDTRTPRRRAKDVLAHPRMKIRHLDLLQVTAELIERDLNWARARINNGNRN